VIARERCRHHANPEDDGGRRLSRLLDADDVSMLVQFTSIESRRARTLGARLPGQTLVP
jgi:hypothetical protein